MSASNNPVNVTHLWKPSCARRVVLDGFLAVPRGAPAVSSGPLTWPPKDPSDVLDYELDASQALLGNEGDVISYVAVAVEPPGELAVGQMTADGAIAAIWFSGGVAGTTYVVDITLHLASGRVIGRAVALPVQRSALWSSSAIPSPGVPSTALTTQAGVVVLDENGVPILVSG